MAQKIATTAQELKEKYGKKRLSSSSAGKSIIYSYLYAGYQVDEGVPQNEIQPLYRDIKTFRDKVEDVSDAKLYNAYVQLQEWTSNAFETAIFMRNALKSVIAHFRQIAASAIAGENLRSELGEQAEDNKVSLWLNLLTIDDYSRQSNAYSVDVLRENIATGLRYLNAYNTFIGMVADAIEIPEFAFFKVNMSGIDDLLKDLNKVLHVLRERVSSAREVDGYLKETLDVFEPVEDKAAPIPEENIRTTDDNIRYFTLQGRYSWAATFKRLYSGYWR